MRFEGKEFDELLSGYLDDRLTEAESSVVRDALASDSKLLAHFEGLTRVSSEVKRLSSENRTQKLSSDFAQQVIAEAQRRAFDQGLPESHHVRRGENRQRNVLRPQKPSWRTPAGIIGAIACLAAVILIMSSVFTNPNNDVAKLNPQGADQGNSLADYEPTVNEPAVEESAVEDRYVSEVQENNLAFVFVVDLELSREAWESDYLAEVFASSGITLEAPIVAGDEIQAEIAKARMEVLPEDGSATEAQLYFVHADDLAVAKALNILYEGIQDVPTLRFGLLFDNPLNSVTYRIAKSTGKRFSMKDSIAAPIVTNASARVSPFSGIGAQGMLVSSEKRKGSSAKADFSLVSDGESTILLLLRLPK